MRLNLIFGFLGSGKTTLLRRILTEGADPQSTAVIVNEFGDVGIDGDILEGQSLDMIQLTSGCFCCTLKGALNTAIEELQARGGIERIIVEASGLAEPADTLESLWDPQFGTVTDLDLGPVICVVDTPKFPKIREILGEFYTEQIVHADVVLLNKIDLAKTGELDTMHDDIATLNPNASLIYTEQCDTDLEILLAGKSAKAPEPAEHHHDHEHEHTQFDSLVLGCDGDVGLGAIEKFFNGLDDHVLRAKGFMTIDGEPRLVQFATGQLDIHPAPSAHDDSRGRRMVFIGKEMDLRGLEKQFYEAQGQNR